MTSKKSEPAYKTLPPIHDPEMAKSVYDRVLGTPLMVTTHKLLSLSPEVRTKLREAVTNRRTPKAQEEKAEVKAFEAADEEEDLYEEAWTSSIEVAESFMGSEKSRENAIYADDIFEQILPQFATWPETGPRSNHCGKRILCIAVDHSNRRQ